jgi:hypothetical protein
MSHTSSAGDLPALGLLAPVVCLVVNICPLSVITASSILKPKACARHVHLRMLAEG